MKPESSVDLPPLARVAGAFLLAASLFAVAAIVAFGTTYNRSNVPAWLFVILGFLCLALWLVGRTQAQKFVESVPLDAAGKSRALIGVNAVSSVLLVAVLLIGFNYIAGRRHKTFDLTKNRVNSLADQTYKALDALPRPVKLTYYYYAERADPSAQSLLDNYKRASDKISADYVNLALEPSRAPAAFTGQPMLMAQLEKTAPALKTGQKPSPDASTSQEVSSINEQGITSALLKLTAPKSAKIYFLSGHGEVQPNQIVGAKSALEAQNYTLDTLSLLQKGAKIPADAAALIVASPQVDLGEAEAKLLTIYLNSKGRLAFLLSPARGDVKLPRWNALLKSVGAQAGNGFVLDSQQAYQSPQLPVGLLSDKSRHPILAGTSASVVFPGALPLRAVTPAPAGLTFTPLFESSAASQSSSGDKGPFVLAAAAEKAGSRVFIVSSASFASDQALALFGDRSFLLSGVNWTVGNDALVSIPPKTPTTNTLNMPTPTARFASFVSLLVMPFLALLMGTIVWWLRR